MHISKSQLDRFQIYYLIDLISSTICLALDTLLVYIILASWETFF